MAAEASWNPFNVYQRWKEHKAMKVEQGKLDPISPKMVAPLPHPAPSTPRQTPTTLCPEPNIYIGYK
jgi:hypothetical protein